MRAQIVTPSRELFGSDRSAVRLAALLRDIGVEAQLAVPRSRPERGLANLAGEVGIPVVAAPVLVASSRGLSDPLALAPGSDPAPEADLTIYNSAAVAACANDTGPRMLVLREWLDPASLRHRLLSAVHRRRMTAAVAVSRGVAERWRACAGDRIRVDVCHNWLEEEWLEGDHARDREGVLFVGRLNAWKGYAVLADAYERAFAGARSRPSLTFLGAEAATGRFARRAERFQHRCRNRGWELRAFTPEPRPLLERAALVVVPSLRPEPFGNVVLEALAAGANVLAFPGGGVDDLAPMFTEAITVVDRSTAALAEALKRWWLNGGRAQDDEVHRRVIEGLRERFTGPAVRPQWERLVERVGP